MFRRAAPALLSLSLVVACGGDDAQPEPDPTTGTATLAFSVAEGVRTSMSLQDMLTGDIYGAVYLAEEVNLAGPSTARPPTGRSPSPGWISKPTT